MLIKNLFIILFILSPFFSLSIQAEKKVQYVMVSFDGSKNLNMWENILENADRFNAKFTFFVSGVYFLSQENSHIYTPPGLAPGTSHIGFGGTNEDVQKRVSYVRQAILNGHEIASHANGHFAGGQTTWKGKTVGYNWTSKMWYHELESFLNFLLFVSQNNNLNQPQNEIEEWHYLLRDQIRGFRAPNLSVNNGLLSSLSKAYQADSHLQIYTYNSSSAKNITIPTKSEDFVWDFPLGHIKIAGTNKKTIAMDYNFYVSDSRAKLDSANADKFEMRYYQSLMNYFNLNYKKTGAPLFIGNHFSTWNNGAYYKGLMRFVSEVCKLKDVKCITMDEYAKILDKNNRAKVMSQSQSTQLQEATINNFMPSPLINKLNINKEIPLNCDSNSHNEVVDAKNLKLNF